MDEPAPAQAPAPQAGPSVPGTLHGLPASPGIAIGAVRRFHTPDLEVPDEEPGDPVTERRRLDAALVAVRDDIETQRASWRRA